LPSCLLGLPRAAHSRRHLFANAAIAASRVGSRASATSFSQRRRLASASVRRGSRAVTIIESEHGGVIHSCEAAKDSTAPAPISLRCASPKASGAITFNGGSPRRALDAREGVSRAHALAFEFLGMVADRLTGAGNLCGHSDRLVFRGFSLCLARCSTHV
jgi:hypothetical protein